MNKIGGNKVIIGMFIMFMPMLWSPMRLAASVLSSSVDVQQKDEKKVSLNVKDMKLKDKLAWLMGSGTTGMLLQMNVFQFKLKT